MARPFPAWVAGTCVVAALLSPLVAHADPASDAKDLFARGRDFRAKGDCASASPLFRKAYEVYPTGLGSLRNVAECEEQLGHFASSRRSWLDLRRALLTEDAHKYQGWSQDADQAAARLAPKLARVTIDLNVVAPDGAAADPRVVDVTLDDEAIATTLVGTPLERDPGRHTVRVAGARVQEPQQKVVDLAAGDSTRVALRVVVTPDKIDPNDAVLPPAGARLPQTPPVSDESDSGRKTRRLLGWVAVGVGGAALVGSGISLVVRQSAINDLDNACGSRLTGCSPSLKSTASRGQTASVLFDVLAPIGVVGVGGGLALVFTNAPKAQQTGLVVTPHLGGATATWRF